MSETVLFWIGSGLALLNVINAVTAHFSRANTWWGRLLLQVAEYVSVLTSRDSRGTIKAPLTSRAPE